MSDPATDPAHDLVDQPQDELRAPRVKLGTFLALLRVLGGESGVAGVSWHGGGYTYRVTVQREDGPDIPAYDVAPDAPPEVLDQLLRALADELPPH